MERLLKVLEEAPDRTVVTADQLAFHESAPCRVGRLLITCVHLKGCGLIGATLPEHSLGDEELPDAPSSEAAAQLAAEMASLGLPTSFGGAKQAFAVTKARKKTTHIALNAADTSPTKRQGSWTHHAAANVVTNVAVHPTSDAAWQQAFDPGTGSCYFYSMQKQVTQWSPPPEGYLDCQGVWTAGPILPPSPLIGRPDSHSTTYRSNSSPSRNNTGTPGRSQYYQHSNQQTQSSPLRDARVAAGSNAMPHSAPEQQLQQQSYPGPSAAAVTGLRMPSLPSPGGVSLPSASSAPKPLPVARSLADLEAELLSLVAQPHQVTAASATSMPFHLSSQFEAPNGCDAKAAIGSATHRPACSEKAAAGTTIEVSHSSSSAALDGPGQNAVRNAATPTAASASGSGGVFGGVGVGGGGGGFNGGVLAAVTAAGQQEPALLQQQRERWQQLQTAELQSQQAQLAHLEREQLARAGAPMDEEAGQPLQRPESVQQMLQRGLPQPAQMQRLLPHMQHPHHQQQQQHYHHVHPDQQHQMQQQQLLQLLHHSHSYPAFPAHPQTFPSPPRQPYQSTMPANSHQPHLGSHHLPIVHSFPNLQPGPHLHLANPSNSSIMSSGLATSSHLQQSSPSNQPRILRPPPGFGPPGTAAAAPTSHPFAPFTHHPTPYQDSVSTSVTGHVPGAFDAVNGVPLSCPNTTFFQPSSLFGGVGGSPASSKPPPPGFGGRPMQQQPYHAQLSDQHVAANTAPVPSAAASAALMANTGIAAAPAPMSLQHGTGPPDTARMRFSLDADGNLVPLLDMPVPGRAPQTRIVFSSLPAAAAAHPAMTAVAAAGAAVSAAADAAVAPPAAPTTPAPSPPPYSPSQHEELEDATPVWPLQTSNRTPQSPTTAQVYHSSAVKRTTVPDTAHYAAACAVLFPPAPPRPPAASPPPAPASSCSTDEVTGESAATGAAPWVFSEQSSANAAGDTLTGKSNATDVNGELSGSTSISSQQTAAHVAAGSAGGGISGGGTSAGGISAGGSSSGGISGGRLASAAAALKTAAVSAAAAALRMITPEHPPPATAASATECDGDALPRAASIAASDARASASPLPATASGTPHAAAALSSNTVVAVRAVGGSCASSAALPPVENPSGQQGQQAAKLQQQLGLHRQHLGGGAGAADASDGDDEDSFFDDFAAKKRKQGGGGGDGGSRGNNPRNPEEGLQAAVAATAAFLAQPLGSPAASTSMQGYHTHAQTHGSSHQDFQGAVQHGSSAASLPDAVARYHVTEADEPAALDALLGNGAEVVGFFDDFSAAAKKGFGTSPAAGRVTLEPAVAQYLRNVLPRTMSKYWLQRYSLFSRFDEGIQMDTEGWYSVTPEVLATHQAAKSCSYSQRGGLIAMDACCGCGGNVIQMALMCPVVVGVEISAKRIAMAEANARVYGVADKCEWLCCDFFHAAPTLKADIVFMSPPWGGPSYRHADTFDVYQRMPAMGVSVARLMEVALHIVAPWGGVVAAFLPRNTDLRQLATLVPEAGVWEVERNYLNGKLKGITVYASGLGGLTRTRTDEQLHLE